MVVVMTGSPGGALGGATGCSFGSGLSALTNPIKPNTTLIPNVEVWSRRCEENKQIITERKIEEVEKQLSNPELGADGLAYLRKKEEQLRKEKEQLRTKEEQMRDSQRQSLASHSVQGGVQTDVKVSCEYRNTGIPRTWQGSP